MNTYLSESQISRIANIYNTTFSKANKTKLKELGTKYNLTFDQTRQHNMNAFWLMVTQELMQDPKAIDTMTGFNFARNKQENNWMTCKEMIFKRIESKYKEDYQFLCDFKPENLLYEINEIIRFSGLHYLYEIDELYKVDNYEKYFSKMFGIESIDPKAVKNTQRVADFFNTLFNGIPNKNLNTVIEYLQHQDITTLHNTLHITD